MRLGNDIIDRAAAQEQHPRFARRILSPSEWQVYQADPKTDNFDKIWHYWAAKEAAYKAYQQTKTCAFSPAAWICLFEQNLVFFEEERLPLRLLADGDLLLAEVCDQDWHRVASLYSQFWTEPTPEDQSLEARRLALALASEHLGFASEDCRVDKHGKIPSLYHSPSQQRFRLSLTHHGRFVAASLLLIPIQS